MTCINHITSRVYVANLVNTTDSFFIYTRITTPYKKNWLLNMLYQCYIDVDLLNQVFIATKRIPSTKGTSQWPSQGSPARDGINRPHTNMPTLITRMQKKTTAGWLTTRGRGVTPKRLMFDGNTVWFLIVVRRIIVCHITHPCTINVLLLYCQNAFSDSFPTFLTNILYPL